MSTLFLTASERALYDKLSDGLKEGWAVENEALTYDDSPQKQAIRLSLLRIHDPHLLELRNKVSSATSMDDIAALLSKTNISEVQEDEVAQLFFALGPESLARLIGHLLRHAKTDGDMEGVTALTVIRHTMLESLPSVAG